MALDRADAADMTILWYPCPCIQSCPRYVSDEGLLPIEISASYYYRTVVSASANITERLSSYGVKAGTNSHNSQVYISYVTSQPFLLWHESSYR